MIKWLTGALGAAALLAAATYDVAAQQPNQMSFFVTSVGSGQGANLGGLAGARRRIGPWSGSKR